jgi:hypothetical protein
MTSSPTWLRTLRKLPAHLEASYFLRPTAGHGDPSRPQPRRFLVGHIDDGETAEVLSANGPSVNRGVPLDASTLKAGESSRPPVKIRTPAALICATNGLSARDFSCSCSSVCSGTHSSLKAMRYSVMSPPRLA